LLAILGYFYDIAALYGVGAYFSVALHTAVGFVAVNLDVLLVRPRRGLMAVVTSNTAGGVMARRLLPFALTGPFMIGWLYIRGEALGFISSGFGIVLVTVVYVTLVTSLIFRTAKTLSMSEQKLRDLYELSPLGIVLTDMKGHTIESNEAFQKMTGYSQVEFKNLDEGMLTSRASEVQEAQQVESLERTGLYGPLETEYSRKDGSRVPVRLTGMLTSRRYGRKYIWSIVEDITERQQAQDRLRWAALLFANIQDGAVVTDRLGCILAINPAFTAITGYTEAEIVGKNMRSLQSEQQDPAAYQQMWEAIVTTGGWQGEIWDRRHNGDRYLNRISIHTVGDKEGKVVNYVGTYTDITCLKKAHQMEHLAHHDALTGLPNRLQFLSLLEHAVETSKRHRSEGAVLFFDLDHFKAVNDTWGHPAGDELLQQVARRLSGRVRDMDTMARLCGDEFVMVLENLDSPENAASVATDVVQLLKQPFALAGGQEACIGGSVGIAMFPSDGSNVETLMRHAGGCQASCRLRG